jgi:hypothetical protein
MKKLVLFVLLFGQIGLAETIKVPQDYPKIQTAINFAEPGDEVVVDDGVWTGSSNKNLDFIGKAIIVRSKNGPENCVIDCEDEGSAFWFHNEETNESIVQGFTITRASSSAILCDSADPTIFRCLFESNDSDYGACLNLDYSVSLIKECVFQDNRASYGGGAYISGGRPRFERCIFIANRAVVGGGIYDGYNSYATVVKNCLFFDNISSNGGGITGYYTDLTNCTFVNNSTYAVWAMVNANLIVTNCIFKNNTPGQISGNPTVSYSNVQGGWPGHHNIDEDPLFVTGPMGNFYLSHIKAGQEANSPSINMGNGTARELGLKKMTTRVDRKADKRAVDMGYHYPKK